MKTISLELTQEQIRQLLSQQGLVINLCLSEKCDLTSDSDQSFSFIAFFEKQLERMRQNGNPRTTETYITAFHKFRTFCGVMNPTIGQITSELMEKYQTWLKERNLALNTISFYMRKLRRIYHLAVEDGLTIDCQPFTKVYTGQAKTDKRAISIEEMRQIKNLTIQDQKTAFARDLFLFSFYTRGMSFVDIAYLQPKNIRHGMLVYKRRKTGQLLSVQWEKDMQDIVSRYTHSGNGKFLFPIIRKENGKERNQYRHIQDEVNKELKIVARLSGIGRNLTMYCARHSWASIARQLQVPMEVISRGMGHTHERTTEIYLKSIDSDSIDRANRQILQLLRE